MGVYIKGVEMPTICEDCPCFYPEYNECNAIVGRWVDGKGTPPSDCPLVYVPAHGDLIDRNALILRVDMHGTNKFGMLDEDIRQFINDAPTIILADQVKEET